MVSVKQQQQYDIKLSGLFMLLSYYDMILKMMTSVKFVLPNYNHPIVHVYAQSHENQTLKAIINKKTNSLIEKWLQNKKCDSTVIAKNIEENMSKTNDKIKAIIKRRNLT